MLNNVFSVVGLDKKKCNEEISMYLLGFFTKQRIGMPYINRLTHDITVQIFM